MDEKTLTALKESIEKWEKRAAGDHTLPLGVHACPLCVLNVLRTGTCNKCPIFEKTGEHSCENTPYVNYVDNATNANAQRELDFLKSLLPAEEANEEARPSFGWIDLKYLG